MEQLDITHDSVFAAFIEHRKLKFTDFAQKEIFLNILPASDRLKLLARYLQELENFRKIRRLDGTPPNWELVEVVYKNNDLLNTPRPKFYKTEKERNIAAIGLIDQLIPLLEENHKYSEFALHKLIHELNLPSEEEGKAIEVMDQVEKIFSVEKIAVKLTKSSWFLLTDKGRELLNYRNFVVFETDQKKKYPFQFTHNEQHIGVNNGVNAQMNDQSSVTDFRPATKPKMQPTIAEAKQGKKTWLGKLIEKYIIPNTVNVIIALLIAFLVYRLGWNR